MHTNLKRQKVHHKRELDLISMLTLKCLHEKLLLILIVYRKKLTVHAQIKKFCYFDIY